jgi:hypothetical protein
MDIAHQAAPVPEGQCRNCNAPAPGRYCPECGQETAAHPPSALEFLHEFIGHYVALEGALWRTLKKLAIPGALTLEYFAGRRRRYVLPLRLYLTASIVFFLVAKVFVPVSEVHVVRVTPGSRQGMFTACELGDTLCAKVRDRMVKRLGEMPEQKLAEYLLGRLVAIFPYAMFVLVPVFAMLTRLAYWNRPYNYGEHLVFALHYHAAAFLIGAMAEPFREAMLWTIPAGIYLAVAMQRVFAGRAWANILRVLFVYLSYFILVVASMMAIVTATFIL